MLNKKFDIKQVGENKRTLEIYLYGEIQGDYYDWRQDGMIESTTSANYVRKALDEAGEVDNINIYINSIGGSVAEGNAIFNILKRSSAYKTVYVDAYAYSVASVIAMCADKIVMPSNTTMMIHNAVWGCYGNSAELRKSADDLDIINEASCNSYLIKAGDKLAKEQLTEMLNAETYLTAEKALEVGLCDEIANPVNLAEAADVIEQAKQMKNPYAKQAMQFLQSSERKPQPQPETPPKAEEPPQQKDKYEWLSDLINSKKFL